MKDVKEMAFGDIEVGDEGSEADEEMSESDEEELGPGVKRVYDVEDAEDITNDEACIVYPTTIATSSSQEGWGIM